MQTIKLFQVKLNQKFIKLITNHDNKINGIHSVKKNDSFEELLTNKPNNLFDIELSHQINLTFDQTKNLSIPKLFQLDFIDNILDVTVLQKLLLESDIKQKIKQKILQQPEFINKIIKFIFYDKQLYVPWRKQCEQIIKSFILNQFIDIKCAILIDNLERDKTAFKLFYFLKKSTAKINISNFHFTHWYLSYNEQKIIETSDFIYTNNLHNWLCNNITDKPNTNNIYFFDFSQFDNLDNLNIKPENYGDVLKFLGFNNLYKI